MEHEALHKDLNEILMMLKEKLCIDNAIIRRLEGEELKTVAYFGYRKEEAMLRIMIGEGVTGLCAQKKSPVVINDLSHYGGAYLAGIDNSKSEFCMPLMLGNGLIGTFNTESTARDNFTPERIELITRLGGMLASSVANLENRTGRLLASALARLEKSCV
jgi:putative methionine-R-sulfoxide reductase with GAF domain